jgi:peroxiredoxin
MVQLRQDYREFVNRGARVIVIGPEDEETFSNWWVKHRMPFIGIPDPEHKVAKLYGQEFNIFKLGRMPEVVVVDKNGNIRLKHKGRVMADIPTNKTLLTLLDEINAEEGEWEEKG